VPVLVLRDLTERPEAVEAGVALVVGTDRDHICAVAGGLLGNEVARTKMARIVDPFGDGKAAPRVALRIAKFLAASMSERGASPGRLRAGA
jgi:UDP-N-acetylglucosamine 2-epimerase (non-hydrolysing)